VGLDIAHGIVFKEQYPVILTIDDRNLKIFGAGLDEQVVLMKKLFIKTVVFNFLD